MIIDARNYLPTRIEYIYCLRSPFDLSVFYVGRTQNLKKRLHGHIHDGKKFLRGEKVTVCEEKAKHIAEILSCGGIPVIQILEYIEVRLEKIDEIEVSHKEIHWINWMYKMGWELMNGKNFFYKEHTTAFAIFKREMKNRYFVDSELFYWGKDERGNRVYDFKRAKSLGLKIYGLAKDPVPESEFKETTTYVPCYEDDPAYTQMNPNWDNYF
jgi:hypothetical protein